MASYKELEALVLDHWKNAKILDRKVWLHCLALTEGEYGIEPNGYDIYAGKQYKDCVFYILECGGRMSMGLRYGEDGSEYFSPLADQEYTRFIYERDNVYKEKMSRNTQLEEGLFLTEVGLLLTTFRYLIDEDKCIVNDRDDLMDRIFEAEKHVDLHKADLGIKL